MAKFKEMQGNSKHFVANEFMDLTDPWIAAHHPDTIARYRRKGIPLSGYQVKILHDLGWLQNPTDEEKRKLRIIQDEAD